jgi:signal transduction histidine kinase
MEKVTPQEIPATDSGPQFDPLARELDSARNTISVLMDRVEAMAAREQLHKARLQSEDLVHKRNADLNQLNKGLLQAAAEHQKCDRILLEMQRVAEIGGWELNLETGLIDTTGQIKGMLGLPENSALTIESLCAQFSPADARSLQEHIQAAHAHKRPFELDLSTVPSSGSSKILRLVGRPLVEGMITSRVYGVIWDITRQKATELQLSQSERFSRATLDAQTSCIVALDSKGEILLANRAWREFNDGTGFFENCDVGDNYLDCCDKCIGESASGERSFARQLRELLGSDQNEVVLEFQGGPRYKHQWFRVIANRPPEFGEIRLVVVHRDFTVQKRMQELERERRGLQDAIGSLDQVLGVVGHELRTPLAGLRAITDFLMDPNSRGTPEWTAFLTALGDEVVRMSDMVDNLLEAARLNSGRARWNWSRVNLPRVCQEVADSARMLIKTDKINVGCQLDSVAAEMLGDSGGIRRLLLNLTNNAAKHTESGTIVISGSVRYSQQQRWIELSVSDTGRGIAPAILARAGDPFALNSGIVGDKHVSGTGLGLAICKGIAAAHGGYLKIESTVGKGTTVTVSLRADLPGPIASSSEHALLGRPIEYRSQPAAASVETGESL